MSENPMPQDDPLYIRIYNFFKIYYNDYEYDYYKYYNYKHIKQIIDINKFKYGLFIYNKDILDIIISYINIITDINYRDKKLLKKFKKHEPIFLNLLASILKNNYWNIRYDFTIYLICYNIDIKYFEDKNILYQLENINPNKYIWGDLKKQKERAKYIYDRTKVLQMAWIMTIIKAQI